jgi:hypothetical protein
MRSPRSSGVVGDLEDDDAEAAVGRPRTSVAPPPKAAAAGGRITEKQARRLWTIAKGAKWSTDALKQWLADAYEVNSIREIAMTDYDAICAAVARGPEIEPEASVGGSQPF